MSRFIENFLKRKLGIPPVDSGLAEREAFLETPEAETIGLSDYDKRFGITEIDYPPGKEPSNYYKPDDTPEERARKQAQLEEFLAEGNE